MFLNLVLSKMLVAENCDKDKTSDGVSDGCQLPLQAKWMR